MTTKTYTIEECLKHCDDKDCWLIIDGKVYDVTPFLDEHPGGFDTMVSNSGKDATEEFEEIGHSRAAKEMLDKYYIGDFAGGAPPKKAPKRAAPAAAASPGSSGLSSLIKALLPLLIVLAAVYYMQLQQGKA
ncbi:hypothetical protein ABPG77_007231 [Micractinium sp. CCAP 211/92]